MARKEAVRRHQNMLDIELQVIFFLSFVVLFNLFSTISVYCFCENNNNNDKPQCSIIDM